MNEAEVTHKLANATRGCGGSSKVINYVVEVAAADKPWITWPDGSTPTADEGVAWASYGSAMNGWRAPGFQGKVRLVKRTATISDEVLAGGTTPTPVRKPGKPGKGGKPPPRGPAPGGPVSPPSPSERRPPKK